MASIEESGMHERAVRDRGNTGSRLDNSTLGMSLEKEWIAQPANSSEGGYAFESVGPEDDVTAALMECYNG